LSELKTSNKKKLLLSWAIFLPTLIVVLLTLILGMFPALITTFSDEARFPIGINAFEPGIWMVPILISNSIFFAIIILYRKNKLPQNLTSLFKAILNFEISHKTALVLVGIMIISYVLLNVGELYTQEHWGDFGEVKKNLDKFSDNPSFGTRMIPYFFGVLSLEIFGSYRIAPFIASIFCLFLTYLVTVQISKKRFAGIVALGVVLQSQNFLVYDTIITYPILWIMFFLLSLYFIFKIFPLSPIAFGAAALSHPLTLGFFPAIFAFIALLDLPKRKKILLLSIFFAFIVIGLGAIYMEIIKMPVGFTFDSTSSLDVHRILDSSSSILTQFRYDSLIILFLLPLVVCLFLASIKGVSNANSVLVLIANQILLILFIPALTGLGNTPYRILPLVFFFALGVGILFSKKN